MSQISTIDLAARAIRVFEGLRLSAYRDAVGILTIGFGHTKGVSEGQVITMAEAEAFLAEDAAPLVALVAAMPPLPPVDATALRNAALVSFGYNCGPGALARVISGKASLIDFNKAGGRELAGLTARRALESGLISIAEGK